MQHPFTKLLFNLLRQYWGYVAFARDDNDDIFFLPVKQLEVQSICDYKLHT